MMKIGDRAVGQGQRPYLIAEMSGNHNHDLDRALAIVDAAAASGADAVKLQTYTADTMTLKVDGPDFVISNPESLWHNRHLYDLYDEAHTPWDWHGPIMERAASHGMHCFSSPFDATAVDFLESLNVPAYKIASFEMIDLPLIRKVAATGKPMIMSTGMANVAEIAEAVAAAKGAGARDIVLLKCTSTYPATPENSNLNTIPNMRATFGVDVGLSDHTMGCGVAVASIAMGTCVIEKHFTLARADGGVDSAFSMEPAEFALMRAECDRAWQAMGGIAYGVSAEEGSRQFRRSLYIARDVAAGSVLTDADVRAIRPGFGLPPKFLDQFIGKKVHRDLAAGTRVTWDILS